MAYFGFIGHSPLTNNRKGYKTVEEARAAVEESVRLQLKAGWRLPKRRELVVSDGRGTVVWRVSL